MTKKFPFLFFIAFTACSTAPQPKPAEEPVPTFIQDLPGPPAFDSSEEQSDHQTLFNLQQTRTKAECARAASEVKISLAAYYGKPYGFLSKDEIEQLTPFFEEANKLAWNYIGTAKKRWHRPRPYVAYPDLHPCIQKEESFSYPSGHSAMSRYYYEMLLVLYPKKKAELLTRSDQIAQDRAIGGVHYPTDIRDGKKLGEEIFRDVVKIHHLDERLKELKKTLN